jgi:Asp-tRNA(Asn)/Glu-tRNA(Gln) amidotransferase A subunit family amidase
MNEIIKMTATELAEKIKTKQLKSAEVVQAFIKRAKETDSKIKAYMEITKNTLWRRLKPATRK